MKTCSDCGERKPLAAFYPKRRPSGGHSSYCRPCNRERVRRWREANPEKVRALRERDADRRRGKPRPKATPERCHAHVCRRYGLTVEQYAEILAAQGGVCAVCREPETIVLDGRVKRLAIDHDHATGRVRGLLCSACNYGLGKFRDDPVRLRAAADYLERAA